MFAHLARAGLAVREDRSVVAVHHTHHEIRGTHVVDVLLLDLVVEHSIEEEVLRRLRVVCFRVSHTDLTSLGVRSGGTDGVRKGKIFYM